MFFRRSVLLSSVLMVLLLVMFNYVDAGVEDSVRTFNTKLFNTLRFLTGLVVFITLAWQVVEGYFQENLNTRWMKIIVAAVFLGILSVGPTIFQGLTGVQATNSNDSGTIDTWTTTTPTTPPKPPPGGGN